MNRYMYINVYTYLYVLCIVFRFSLRFAEQTDYQFEKCTEWPAHKNRVISKAEIKSNKKMG